MSIQRVAGAVLVVGSIFFIIAAFLPISRVFAEPDTGKKLEIIQNERSAWTVAQFFFASGAVITAIGLGLMALQFRSIPRTGIIYLAVAVAVIGAGLWSWHVYLRAVDPAAFTGGLLPSWQFAAYTILTQAGLATFGIFFLLRPEMANWVGWLLVVGMAVLFVVYLILKDIPPFVYYILTLLMGIMVYRMG